MGRDSALPQAMSPAGDFLGSDIVLGVVVAQDDDAYPLVKIDGADGIVRAQMLDHLSGSLKDGMRELPAKALIAVPQNARGCPVLLGFVASAPMVTHVSNAAVSPADDRDVQIDGRRVVLEGDQEVVLRCGKSSITLKRDGKIVIKGKDVLSRASRNNKVKGASVNIN